MIKSLSLIFTAMMYLLLLNSCSYTKVTITKTNNTQHYVDSAISYTDYWSAIVYLMPELASDFQISEDKIKFANGLSYVKKGDIVKAETIYSDLFTNSENDTIVNVSKDILSYLYNYQSKWLEHFNLMKDKDIADSFSFKNNFYSSYIAKPPQKVFFPIKPDTNQLFINSGLPFIEVEINGETFKFLFDTGAEITVISQNVANICDIRSFSEHHSAGVSGFGDSFYMKTSIIDTLRIGNTIINNMPSVIVNDDNLNFKLWFITLLGFDGIIGWNVIKNFNTEIDFNDERLIVKKPKIIKSNKRNLFWLAEPIISFYGEKGEELFFLFDSGARHSSANESIFNKIKVENTEETESTIYTLAGKRKITASVIENINFYLGENKLQFENLESHPSERQEFYYLDGTFGSDICDQGKITIDPMNGIFSIEPYE